MNRETRKANLKKLQLPGTSTTRHTRSQHSNNTVLTQFFNNTQSANILQAPNATIPEVQHRNFVAASIPAEEYQVLPPALIVPQTLRGTSTSPLCNEGTDATKSKRAKRTKLDSFLFKDKQDVPKITKDFAELEKQVKKVPKTKAAASTKTKKNSKTRSKRQQSIKSAFLRNEEVFSEITAQHCLADNFSPDDMQLALAMSKSEAEKSGLFSAEDVEEVVVDVTKADGDKAQESIRSKLQRYGFRTAAKEDYNTITAAFSPGGLANRRFKAKWANKFTALTLRDASQQLKKVNEKISALFKKQCITKLLNEEESRPKPFRLFSPALKNLVPLEEAKVYGTCEQCTTDHMTQFYVKELFEVSKVKPGHLLKDWSSIQGRDSTPENLSSQRKRKVQIREQKLLEAYQKLEDWFIKGRGNKEIFVETNKSQEQLKHKTELCGDNVDETTDQTTNENEQNLDADVSANDENELDLMLELIANESPESVNELPQIISTESTTIADGRIVEIRKCVENPSLLVGCSSVASPLKEPPDKKLKLQFLNSEEDKNCLKTNIQNERTRATSPDIFADSEDEMEISVETEGAPPTDEKCITFEIYSSDEVKTCSTCAEKLSVEQMKAENFCPVVVDLTEDETIATLEASITSKKINEVFDIFLSSPSEPESVLEKESAHNEKKSSQTVMPVPKTLLTAASDVATELQTSKTTSGFFTLDSDEDELLLEIKSAKINSFQDFQGNKQISTSFHLETAMQKDASRHQLDDSNCESFNESMFKLLQRKYLSSMSKSKTKSKRKSVSMTQLNVADSSISKTSRKRLSFTQWEQQIYKEIEAEDAKKYNINSPFKVDAASIDLTQSNENNCGMFDAEEDDCIILSDDEINYSIWKADKTMQLDADEEPQIYTQDLTKSSDSENVIDNFVDDVGDVASKSSAIQEHEFSFQELLHVNKSSIKRQTSALDFDTDNEPLQSQFLATQCDAYVTPTKPADLSKERAEFGILDSYSEPLLQSPFLTPTKHWKSTTQSFPIENSFLCSPSEKTAPMKRYSSTSSSQKFNALFQQVQQDEQPLDTSIVTLDDYDEFDKLVYGSPKVRKPTPTTAQKAIPIGLQQLLTADLSFREEPSDKYDYATPKKLYVSPGKKDAKTPTKQEICINGRSYDVRVTTTPKPDFSIQTDAELLKQLYNFGIKPLKRKQALLMLEYIYNQTHPILLNEGDAAEDAMQAKQIETVQTATQETAFRPSQKNVQAAAPAKQLKIAAAVHENKFNLSDCFGYLLLRHQHHLCAELLDEEYIFQTNVSKKLTQALLPLHIAWFNLVCSSTALHEAILMFEPIDLQEVYLFFKSIGYRYDPKDLKLFFDRRCIIFRYDLGAPSKPCGGNRHMRKNKKVTCTQK